VAALLGAALFAHRPAPSGRPGRAGRAPEAPRTASPETVARVFAADAAGAPPAPTLLDRLRSALAELSDEDLLDVRRRLVRMLEDDPARIAELAALFEIEADPDLLEILAEALAGNAQAVSDPAVVAAMLRSAEGPGLEARRGAALQFLQKLPAADPRADDVVLRLARDESGSREFRLGALAAAAAWMQNQPDGAERLWRPVLGTAAAARDSEVRGHAIQAVALLDRPAGAELVSALAPFLRDASAENRALAAMGLGAASPDARASASALIEGAIAVERSAGLQRGLLLHLVRASGPGAEASLARVESAHPSLAADARDYIEILKSQRDPVRVWEEKQRRDAARGVVPGAEEHTD
jgi:hypothetical protein